MSIIPKDAVGRKLNSDIGVAYRGPFCTPFSGFDGNLPIENSSP
jgi:hypothetical protein